VGTGFAWNHGDIQPQIARTFIGMVGPGVRNLGITQPGQFFTDHVDVRPTMMSLLGLKDDYQHDGRVILEMLDPNALSNTVRTHSDTLRILGQVYKQINAPFGDLSESALRVSTYAIKSDSPNDAAYTRLESRIASWTTERNALTAEIKPMLEAAEFDGKAVNLQQSAYLIWEGLELLFRARICAADPAICAR
jgi:hypothetical protein